MVGPGDGKSKSNKNKERKLCDSNGLVVAYCMLFPKKLISAFDAFVLAKIIVYVDRFMYFWMHLAIGRVTCPLYALHNLVDAI